MTKKRFLSCLLCLLLLCSLFPLSASAEDSYPLEITDAHAKRGETATVSVSLNRTAGIAGGSFTVSFDSTVLTLTDAVAGDAISDRFTAVNKHYGEGKIRLIFVGTEELSAAGELLTLSFRLSETAPIGQGIPVTVSDVTLMDSGSKTLFNRGVSGTVSPSAVGVSLSSEDCLPGQSVKLELYISGDLMPAGGKLELHYSTNMLKFGSAKGEKKLGSTAIQFYGNSPESGVISIIWAAAECISENGRLCTLIFDVKDAAAGPATIFFTRADFFDEQAKKLDCTEPVSGIVNVVEDYNPHPTLYVVGGTLAEDGKSAVVDVAVDGAGLVCGGSFTLHYETSRAVLTKMENVMGCVAVNPAKADTADGTLRCTWANDSPSLDNETILRLYFTLTGTESCAISFEDVVLKDILGVSMEGIRAHGGQAGIRCRVQAPVSSLSYREESTELSLTLYDACYTGELPTEAVSIIAACYDSAGRMRSVTLPEDALSFDEFGIAKLDLSIVADTDTDKLRLFVVDAGGIMSPMCVSVAQELS